MAISSLGYIGLGVSSIEAWRTFCVDVLGTMPAAASPAGAARYRIDDQAWRIAVEAGEDDLSYVGFEVAGKSELEEMRRRLTDAGVAVGDGDLDRLAERGVTGLLICQDPEGLAVEIYYGPTLTTEIPFASSAGVSGFVTADQGIGHVVLTTSNIEASRAFYQDILGFRLSDIIRMTPVPNFHIDLEFYHCNRRHHTLALAPTPMKAPKRLHHFMLQTNTLDEVGFALDRASQAGVRIAQSLGRHTNDQMVSFYAETPSGFEVEYGYGALEVDVGAWRVARHDKMSTWGHKRQ